MSMPIAMWIVAVALAGGPAWVHLIPNPMAADPVRLGIELFGLASAVCAICIIDSYELGSRRVPENRKGWLVVLSGGAIAISLGIPTWSSQFGSSGTIWFPIVLLSLVLALSFSIRFVYSAYKAIESSDA